MSLSIKSNLSVEWRISFFDFNALNSKYMDQKVSKWNIKERTPLLAGFYWSIVLKSVFYPQWNVLRLNLKPHAFVVATKISRPFGHCWGFHPQSWGVNVKAEPKVILLSRAQMVSCPSSSEIRLYWVWRGADKYTCILRNNVAFAFVRRECSLKRHF